MAVCRLRHEQGAFWGDSVGRNPTDRGKMGSKRNVLVDRNGGPLSVVVAWANVHDTKLLELTLESVVVERLDGGDRRPQHLCLDKGIRQSHGPPGGGGARVPGTHQANRRGETGRQGRKTLSGTPLGGGGHLVLALQMPGDLGPV